MAWFVSERKKLKALKDNPKGKTTKVREKALSVTIAGKPATRPVIVGPRRKIDNQKGNNSKGKPSGNKGSKGSGKASKGKGKKGAAALQEQEEEEAQEPENEQEVGVFELNGTQLVCQPKGRWSECGGMDYVQSGYRRSTDSNFNCMGLHQN